MYSWRENIRRDLFDFSVLAHNEEAFASVVS